MKITIASKNLRLVRYISFRPSNRETLQWWTNQYVICGIVSHWRLMPPAHYISENVQFTKEQGNNISEISDSSVKICETIKSVRNSLALSANAASALHITKMLGSALPANAASAIYTVYESCMYMYI